jgi:branched-chain amino acid transport system substrate-binding protein
MPLRAKLLALAAGLCLAGCRPRLEIGVVLPETGHASAYGASIKTGVTLAIEDLKVAEPSLQSLGVTYRDSGSDPARAASAAEALFEGDASLVIGGVTSAEARAMIPVADRWKRVLISPSASVPALARLSTYFFRVFPSDDLEGVAAADFLTDLTRARSVLVISEASEYTRGLLPVFVGELQGRGGLLAGNVSAADRSWEAGLRSSLAKSAPDAVYICGYGDFILRVLRLLHAASYSGTICTTSAVHASSLLQHVGLEAEGVVFPLAGMETGPGRERAQHFIERYRRVYSLRPDIYAGHGYDAALAAGLVLTRLETGRESEPRTALRGLGAEMGVMGPLNFDESGNVKHTLGLYQIRAGHVELLGAASRSFSE